MVEKFNPEKKAAKPPRRKPIREMLLLAEQAAESGIKVVPGSAWGFHYPISREERAEKLQGIIDGRYKPEDVAPLLRPSALVYDASDIEAQGLEAVSGKILDFTSYIKNYDFARFAQFAQKMGGHEITADMVDELYGGLIRTRIKKKLYDSYGNTGKRQIESAFATDIASATANFDSLTREQKILTALRADWLAQSLSQLSTDQRDRLVSGLSGSERKLFEELSDFYRKYITSGDDQAYEKLVKKLADGLPKAKREESREQSESMEELEKELEQIKDKGGAPGSEDDPGISDEVKDAYDTPPILDEQEKEGGEGQPEAIKFIIEPPLTGHYAGARMSYYDQAVKTWSNHMQAVAYDETISGGKRHVISGKAGKGLSAIPLPVGYALDATSLKYEGTTRPKLLRDHGGCFYIQGEYGQAFSIDFTKESTTFQATVVGADTEKLYNGKLSPATEQILNQLSGNNIHKAEQLRQYLFAHHFYPGGGDLNMAHALQSKLRNGSSAEEYIRNLDASEYLECYSANTLFVAMARKAGIPARLVLGHMADKASKGKVRLTNQTGHAWAEIFDGTSWRRFDATPAPKPEDKKKGEGQDKEKEKTEKAEKADDGGIDGKPKPGEGEGEGQEGESGEPGEGESSGEGQSSGEPGQIGEADGSAVEQGQGDLKQATEELKQMQEVKEKLEQQLADAKDFKDIAEAKEAIEKSDLLEDMKESLEDKAEATENQMKGEVEEKLDEMTKDGFMDKDRKEELKKLLEEGKLEELDKIKEEIEKESALYEQYNEIRQRVRPLVNKWFKYFYERLPREENVELDEDSLTRRGAYNRKSINRPRNLMFGTVKNPRKFESSFKPRFLASIMLDVSGSMGDGTKITDARTLLVFYSELFSRISEEFGYIQFAINTFSDDISEVKTFQQKYTASQRYLYSDGARKTVKVRLMENVRPTGGTNMLPAIKRAAKGLGEEARKYPDYAAAFYFVGDGGDTAGNATHIKEFMALADGQQGFGRHMRSATMLGDESQKKVLDDLFGADSTTVAPDLDALIHQSMLKFDGDMKRYLSNKVRK